MTKPHFHPHALFLLLLLVQVGPAACSNGNGDDAPDPNDPGAGAADAERFAMDAFEVVGAGELLHDPREDPTVRVTSDAATESVVLEGGEVLNVAIPFEADNGNVVAAGIRFGDTGPIVTVPMPAMRGATAGTMTFQVRVPDNLCDELGSICHAIRCYEFAVTEQGLVSAENVRTMAAACGDCTEPSCSGILDDCKPPPLETPTDFCPAPQAEELFTDPDLDSVLAVDDAYLYFSIDNDIVRLAKNGGDTPEVLVPDAPALELLTIGENLCYQGAATIHCVPKAGGTPMQLAISSGTIITDGEAIYSASGEICTGPRDIKRIELDGTETVLVAGAPCVSGLATTDAHLYWIEEVDDDTARLMRIAKTGGTPEEIVAPGDIDGPMEANDSHVYYEGAVSSRATQPLLRVPHAGGTSEELLAEVAIGGMSDDPADGAIYLNDVLYDGCFRRIDPDGTVTAIASQAGYGSVLVVDDEYVYSRGYDADLNYTIFRARKRP